MKIHIYFCDMTKSFIAYDEDFLDETTPHGIGASESEAIADLADTMDNYFANQRRFKDWMLAFKSEKEISYD